MICMLCTSTVRRIWFGLNGLGLDSRDSLPRSAALTVRCKQYVRVLQ